LVSPKWCLILLTRLFPENNRWAFRQFSLIYRSDSGLMPSMFFNQLAAFASGILIMVRSQSHPLGSLIASDISIGIAPACNDSQNRIVLAPVPRGHSENLDLARVILYSFWCLAWFVVS